MYLGVMAQTSIVPIVPLLVLLHLSEERSSVGHLSNKWNDQRNASLRSALLKKTLALARFFPSVDVSSEMPNYQLYENLTSYFLLLKWDARKRIDDAVQRRWALDAASDNRLDTLITIPGGLTEYNRLDLANRDENFTPEDIEKLRDASNQAWLSSLNCELNNGFPNQRPYLWISREDAEEFQLRLCVFRGAICCTGFRGSNRIQVLSPDPEVADIFRCKNKLDTDNAAIDSVGLLHSAAILHGGKLETGSVIEPAKGNDGFDSLVVLQKPCGTWTIVLIENKFMKGVVNSNIVKDKLLKLKKYRGVVWSDPLNEGIAPKNCKGLGLPAVSELDVVWVLLADTGWTNGLPQNIEHWLKNNSEEFTGHVFLTNSKMFFGPCFSEVNLLQQNR
jgi:hypothetical protein